MDIINGTIVVDPFLVHSSSCNLYILYLISIDIRKADPDFLTRGDKYDEIRDLEIRIHDSAFLSIAYRAVRGTGIRLPSIVALAAAAATPSTETSNPIFLSAKSSSSLSSSNNEIKTVKTSSRGPNDASFQLYNNIQYVGDRITSLFDDETLKTHAINIAQYLLKCRQLPVDVVVAQLAKPGAKAILQKLLNCASDLLSSDPRALGIDISNYIISGCIQKSLDVKAITTKSSTMTPKIKHTILHSHPTLIWIRFYSTHLDIMNVRPFETNNYHISMVCQNVYEFYINRTSPDADLAATNMVIKILEQHYDADIIFCSELQYFSYNKLLFISNYIKFTWCYLLNRPIFNPSTTEDFKDLSVHIIHSLLFLKSNNLAHMSTSTHNPLIAYTGERPRTAINKFDKNAIHQVEGHRAMMTIGKIGDFGSKSNFIEIINEIDIDYSVLDTIV